jgi:hypothetical protein
MHSTRQGSASLAGHHLTIGFPLPPLCTRTPAGEMVTRDARVHRQGLKHYFHDSTRGLLRQLRAARGGQRL